MGDCVHAWDVHGLFNPPPHHAPLGPAPSCNFFDRIMQKERLVATPTPCESNTRPRLSYCKSCVPEQKEHLGLVLPHALP